MKSLTTLQATRVHTLDSTLTNIAAGLANVPNMLGIVQYGLDQIEWLDLFLGGPVGACLLGNRMCGLIEVLRVSRGGSVRCDEKEHL